MTVWQYRPGKWRFEFEHLGKKYGRGGFSTKREARSAEADRRKELKRTLSPAPGDMGFLAAADEYLLLSERKDARKTYKYKSYVFDCFITFAGNVKLRSITPGLVESFLLTRHSNSNANRHRKDLSALFNWAWRRGMMPQNPCLQVEKLREEKRKRAVPSHEEMNRILLAAEEQRPLLLVLYHTMGRVGEILRLRWEDVLFEHRVVVLYTRKRSGGNLEPDTYPMSDTLYNTLWSLYEKRQSEEWVFPNPLTGGRFNHRPKLMRGICKRAGVPYYGFHSIRHYVANLLADSEKVSTKRISRLLRHTNVRTTEIYLGKDMEDLGETIKLLDKNFVPEKNPAQSPTQDQ